VRSTFQRFLLGLTLALGANAFAGPLSKALLENGGREVLETLERLGLKGQAAKDVAGSLSRAVRGSIGTTSDAELARVLGGDLANLLSKDMKQLSKEEFVRVYTRFADSAANTKAADNVAQAYSLCSSCVGPEIQAFGITVLVRELGSELGSVAAVAAGNPRDAARAIQQNARGFKVGNAAVVFEGLDEGELAKLDVAERQGLAIFFDRAQKGTPQDREFAEAVIAFHSERVGQGRGARLKSNLTKSRLFGVLSDDAYTPEQRAQLAFLLKQIEGRNADGTVGGLATLNVDDRIRNLQRWFEDAANDPRNGDDLKQALATLKQNNCLGIWR
jgi:hypothetical protein